MCTTYFRINIAKTIIIIISITLTIIIVILNDTLRVHVDHEVELIDALLDLPEELTSTVHLERILRSVDFSKSLEMRWAGIR